MLKKALRGTPIREERVYNDAVDNKENEHSPSSHLRTPTREDTAPEYVYHTPLRTDDETSVYSNPLSTPRHPEPQDEGVDMNTGLPDFDQNARSMSPSTSASPEQREEVPTLVTAPTARTSALLEAASVLPERDAPLPAVGSTPDRPAPLVGSAKPSVAKVVTCSTVTSDILGFAPEEAIWYTMENTPVSMMKWDRDSEHNSCYQCSGRFGLLNRRHHCRDCGHIFCHSCSEHQITGVQGYTTAVRCCDECFQTRCDREAAGFRYTKDSTKSGIALENTTCRPAPCVVQ